MMYLIQGAELVRPKLWAATIPPMYLDHLKDGFTPIGPYSVVAAKLRIQGGDLAFPPNDAQLLCRGTSESAIFLDTSPSVSPVTDVGVESVEPQSIDGDELFVTACNQLVGEEFALLAKILVKKFRQAHPGQLVEGQGRKWLNQPDNFVAITIQNRDRSLAISIRDVREAENSDLRPKPDRPGYLRFKVSKPAHIGEALRLILASAGRS